MRYAYGVAGALLVGGTALSIAIGPVGAQVAQNSPIATAPQPGIPTSFADLTARLSPAVVNISTKQRVTVQQQADPFAQFFHRFGIQAPEGKDPSGGGQPQLRRGAHLDLASLSRPTAMSLPITILSKEMAAPARLILSPS